MMRFKVFKQMAAGFTAVALIAVLFSSCHRGYGCPATHGYNPPVEVEQPADPSC